MGIYRSSCSLAAILLLASAAPHECPLPSWCSLHGTFGWLWFSVGGFKWCSCTLSHRWFQSLRHQSSMLPQQLAALQSPKIIIHFLLLSSHCLRIQPLHPHRASGQPPLVVFQKDPAAAGLCVWNFWTEVKPLLLLLFSFLISAGGPWALGWHGPSKTHPSCCANIPAIVESWWDVASPRTTMPFFNENHFRIWTKHMNGWRWLLIYLSAQLAQSETAVNFLSIAIFCLYCGILRGFYWFLFYSSRWRRRNFPFTPHQTLPVRCNWHVFARQMLSTSKFDKTSLSKCVCVCLCLCPCLWICRYVGMYACMHVCMHASM